METLKRLIFQFMEMLVKGKRVLRGHRRIVKMLLKMLMFLEANLLMADGEHEVCLYSSKWNAHKERHG